MGARLEKWKGHKLLLHALSLLQPGDWEAWIAGGPQRANEEKYYARIQVMARKLGISGRVRWLGLRRDISRLLIAADIHCQPNTGPEPFGNVFVEAMQAGLPVVTTRLGAAPEIIDETCGVLVDPGDARSLANALERMMAPEVRSNLAGGPARASSLCDPARQLTRMVAVLRRALPEK
jgi:glycosyltransferase involved in cell wall biosynthesis